MKRSCHDYITLRQRLALLVTDASKPQLNNLALFVYGLLCAWHIHLPKIALYKAVAAASPVAEVPGLRAAVPAPPHQSTILQHPPARHQPAGSSAGRPGPRICCLHRASFRHRCCHPISSPKVRRPRARRRRRRGRSRSRGQHQRPRRLRADCEPSQARWQHHRDQPVGYRARRKAAGGAARALVPVIILQRALNEPGAVAGPYEPRR